MQVSKKYANANAKVSGHFQKKRAPVPEGPCPVRSLMETKTESRKYPKATATNKITVRMIFLFNVMLGAFSNVRKFIYPEKPCSENKCVNKNGEGICVVKFRPGIGMRFDHREANYSQYVQ